ncbi:MAG: hypothetical protein Q4C67_11285, partial [Deinococcus sp.]|nr:hypothetical protein [Deinococcus sp.]
QPDLHSHPAAGFSTPQVLSEAPASALPAEVREVLESLIADWRQEAIFSHARGNTQESGAFDECAGDLEARLRALAGAGI